MKRILLISTGQPSTNPRLVKEADALVKAGHEVMVLYSSFIRWADETDKELLSTVNWKYRVVGGSSSQKKSIYLFTRFRFKLARILIRYIGTHFSLAERSQARAYDELLKEAKKIKAHWYIGHNLGALPVAVKAALFNNAKAGFDFEDHYRGEYRFKGIDYSRKVYLENKYVSGLAYFSGASEMITAVTKKNHPYFQGQVVTINNCFPVSQQPPFRNEKADSTLRLFWFGQTVGFKRGLEEVIEALRVLNDKDVDLTIVGRVDAQFKKYFDNLEETLKKQIYLPGIISPDEIPSFAARFDVGLATETNEPENRNMCLTNKIFTYILAGNAVIFSETDMQSAFNKKYRVGELYNLKDVRCLAEKIKSYKDFNKLKLERSHNYSLAKNELNWEKESEKLLAIVQ